MNAAGRGPTEMSPGQENNRAASRAASGAAAPAGEGRRKMQIGLVVDSACDLPLSLLKQHDIEILPIAVRLGEESFVDRRDPEETVRFYQQLVPERGLQAETEPLSIEEIRRLFLDRVVTRYDRVLVLTIASSRSDIFNNATKASFAILHEYRQRRQAAGVESSFLLRVLDSGQLFTGEGVLAWELIRWLFAEPEPHFDGLQRRAETFKQHIYAYAVPQDLLHIRARARDRGDRSVSWLQFQMGTMLDIKPIIEAHQGETRPIDKIRGFETAVERVFARAIKRIESGRLLTPVIVMSYAGDPKEIRRFPSYRELRLRADDAGVALVESPMSITAGIYLGPGAFSLAYAAEE